MCVCVCVCMHVCELAAIATPLLSVFLQCAAAGVKRELYSLLDNRLILLSLQSLEQWWLPPDLYFVSELFPYLLSPSQNSIAQRAEPVYVDKLATKIAQVCVQTSKKYLIRLPYLFSK